MKIFLRRIALFLLPIVVLLYPVDLLLSYWYKLTHREPGDLEVWNAIYEGTAKCDIAVYGSSRAWVQIDPQILSDSLNASVYNFGMDGQNFLMQYMRHKEFVLYNPFPKHIVLSVDVFSLAKKEGVYQLKQFLPFVLWNSNMAEVTVHSNGFKWIEPVLPLVRYSGYRDVLIQAWDNAQGQQSQEAYRNNGYRGMDRHWTDDFENAKKRQASIQLNINSEIGEKLDKFIEECHAAGTRLTFVYCPEHILGQQYVSNRKEIIDNFRSIAKKNNIQFLDYSDMALCHDTTYFYNASHLNREGARLFSLQLAHDLRQMR
jgi:hypothetical protein